MPESVTCPFCLEVVEPRYGTVLLGEHFPFKDRVLFRSDKAWAIAGIAPQVYPYALIITKRHITSLAEASTEERRSILDALEGLRNLGVFPSKELTVFEHGGKVGNRCSCLEHCHLHVIDGKHRIVDWFVEDQPNAVQWIVDDVRTLPHRGRYLFAATYRGGRVLHGVSTEPEEVPTQYFRQLLAARTGSRNWDWHELMNMQFVSVLVGAAKRNLSGELADSEER